jgi:hypothetical protein
MFAKEEEQHNPGIRAWEGVECEVKDADEKIFPS